jgi:hypothetical protein
MMDGRLLFSGNQGFLPVQNLERFMIKKHLMVVAVLLLAGGAFFGCAKKAAIGSQVFTQAPSEIREIWDNAVAADQTNGYVAAITGYHSLMAQKDRLTDEQITTLNAAALAINQRMYAAANSGDPAAKEASLTLAGMQSQH